MKRTFGLTERVLMLALVGCAWPTGAAEGGPKATPFAGELPADVIRYLDASYHGERPASVEQIDLNGDGKPDLVLDMACTRAGECKKSVFENQGAGWRLVGDGLICDDKPEWSAKKSAGKWLAIACASDRKKPWTFDEKQHAYGANDKAESGGAASLAVNGEVKKALALYEAGKFAEAAKAFDKAHDKTQLTDEQLYLRGMAWVKAGNKKKAAEVFKFEGGGDPRKDLAMGDLAWDAGDAGAAVYAYKEYLKKKPADEDAVERAKRRVSGAETMKRGSR